MSGVPNIDFDAEYRFKDGLTPLSADTFNKRLLSIHTRLKRMEQITFTFEGISTELANLGIARVNSIVQPLVDEAADNLAEIGNILIEAQAKLAELQAEGITAGNVTLEGGGSVQAAIDEIVDDIAALVADVAAAEAAIAAINTDPVRYVAVTANTNLVAGQQYRLSAASGSITLTLPASPAVGATIRIIDGGTIGAGPTYTVARNGRTIMALDEDMVLDRTGLDIETWFDGTTWRLF